MTTGIKTRCPECRLENHEGCFYIAEVLPDGTVVFCDCWDNGHNYNPTKGEMG